MKVRKTKKDLKRILDNEHDKVVMLQVLRYIRNALLGRDNMTPLEDPFKDGDLNSWFYFVYRALKTKGFVK